MGDFLVERLEKRRFLLLLVFISVSLLLLTARVVYINYSSTSPASVGYSEKKSRFGSGRGQIYDCNLKKLTETTLTGEEIEHMGKRIGRVNYYKRYSDSQPLCHIIGYLSNDNLNGAAGIELAYNDFLLSANNYVTFSYNTDAQGRLLKGGVNSADYSSYNTKQGVQLTVDRDIQEIVERSAASLKTGAVTVSEVSTGKIKAIASFPTFDCNNLEASLKDKNEPFLNRALENYAVGSVFKVLICAAALESRISENYSHICKGYEYCGDVRFNCHKEEGHGKMDMRSALANSCNPYFISLAGEVGYEKILSLAKEFGIDKEIVLTVANISPAGNLPSERVLSSPAGLANFSFGQGELLASPLKMSCVYQTIANGGILCPPSIVEGIVDREGKLTSEQSKSAPKRVLSENASAKIMEFLSYTVTDGTGKSAQPYNVTAAGKTATAQTGIYFENSAEKLNSWFIGVIPASNPKYVISVMKENGKSGSLDCAPVFKKISEEIVKEGKL